MSKIGISDIALYIPSPYIEIKTIQEMRGKQVPKLARRLERAIETTGQRSIRFPDCWEDSVTLSASSLKCLFDSNKNIDYRYLRYVVVGTETSVDMSKAMSAYVCGLMNRAGYSIPPSLSSFQIQHACAGGTIGIVAVASLLQSSSQTQEHGIVICSDIARYEAFSSAEITQGAGAASILIEKDPKLLELDLDTQGYSSSDVDDFFRPLGRSTAQVKGRYSIQCYNSALDEALSDHAKRRNAGVAEILRETDLFVFHVPFPQIAVLSIKRLLQKHISFNESEIEKFLSERCFYKSLETTAEVGNIYNAALYLNMTTQLANYYEVYGAEIVGKKMLIFSYGSGNTMLVLSARISEQAPEQIGRWILQDNFTHKREASWEEYETWMNIDSAQSVRRKHSHENRMDHNTPPSQSFYLKNIREDGYREYAYKP